MKARRKDAKSVKIKKNADNTKFKVHKVTFFWYFESSPLVWWYYLHPFKLTTSLGPDMKVVTNQ